VWQLVPSNNRLWSDRGFPAVIYVHDGTTLSEDEMTHAETFRDAGFWVVLPTFRGENGNLGTHELLFGELDDLVAAAHFTRALPEIDTTRLAIFGHGTGGMLSALASLVPDLPVQLSVSSAGLRPESAFEVVQGPFVDSARERRLRLFGPNVNHMQSPHVACVAEHDPAVYAEANRLLALAVESQLPLQVMHVPGSRSGSRTDCEARTISYLTQGFVTEPPAR
jgi:dienelactone hydrolase